MIKELQKARLVVSIQEIATVCSHDRQKFKEVLYAIGNKDAKVASNAAWVASHAVNMNPDLMKKSEHKILFAYVNKNSPNGVKRNVLRIWQSIDLPKDMTIQIAELSLAFLKDKKEDIAIRAFAITVLENCLNTIPELQEEIVFLLEKEIPHASSAIKVRIRKLFRNLGKTTQFDS